MTKNQIQNRKGVTIIQGGKYFLSSGEVVKIIDFEEIEESKITVRMADGSLESKFTFEVWKAAS
jgi:hypothetical protein